MNGRAQVHERALWSYVIVDPNGQEIAEVRQVMSRSDADGFAKGLSDNELRKRALAMAAAPDVLLALEEAVRLYEQLQFKKDSSVCGEWANRARDAIALAYRPTK